MNVQVSVIVPAFNAEAYLEGAVLSALRTRYPVHEVLIVEDGSNDDTYRIAQRLAQEHPQRVRLLVHADRGNRGAAASRNLGIRAATGEFVAFLDADDWYLPNRFDVCIPKLQSNPNLDGTYENVSVCFATAQDRRDSPWGQSGLTEIHATSMSNLIQSLCMGYSWQTDAVTLRRSVFVRCGLFNEQLELGEDVELWIRLSCVAALAPGNLQEPVAVYRRHAGNISARTGREMMIVLLGAALRWAETRPLPPHELRYLRKCAHEYTFSNVDQLRRQGSRLGAARLLWELARSDHHALRLRRFWGNLGRLVIH